MLKIIATKQRTIKYKSRDDSVSMQTKSVCMRRNKRRSVIQTLTHKILLYSLTFSLLKSFTTGQFIKNRDLYAKLTVVQELIAFPVISTKERSVCSKRFSFADFQFSTSRLRQDRNDSIDEAFCHLHIVPNKKLGYRSG